MSMIFSCMLCASSAKSISLSNSMLFPTSELWSLSEADSCPMLLCSERSSRRQNVESYI
jgi:hypothetical protein